MSRNFGLSASNSEKGSSPTFWNIRVILVAARPSGCRRGIASLSLSLAGILITVFNATRRRRRHERTASLWVPQCRHLIVVLIKWPPCGLFVKHTCRLCFPWLGFCTFCVSLQKGWVPLKGLECLNVGEYSRTSGLQILSEPDIMSTQNGL